MESYKVAYEVFGSEKQEIVEAENIFKVKDILIEKHETQDICVSVVASTENRWQ